MDDSIIQHLEAERDLLRRKLGAVEAILDLYGRATASPAGSPAGSDLSDVAADVSDIFATPAQDSEPSPPTRLNGRRPDGYTTTIRQIARELITANQMRPVRTREVIATAKERGLTIRGERELSAVAALLSRSPDFASVDKEGWILTNRGSA